MLSEQKLQNIINDPSAGAWLIDKQPDWTSHDVVAKLRSLSGIKAIGHTGTLDPFATGLLICLTGKSTKLVDYFHKFPKTYLAEIKLGCISDTYDRTGQVISNKYQVPSKLEVEKILKLFLGKQQQLPPMFSAKKVKGKKLYELARLGKEVERQPAEIEIYSIDWLNYEPLITNLQLRISCSTGTYVRSLAYDLGQKLGTGAVLWELRRESIGPFKVEQALSLSVLNKEKLATALIPAKDFVESLKLNI